jgi:prolyl-tRNA editing enzyme YbaK/EbsC (Cys-tRNA(Pro) deacylase)
VLLAADETREKASRATRTLVAVTDATSPSPTAAGAGSPLADHPAVSRVRAALAERGATGRVVVLDDHARTAVAAAEQLGVTVAQIANSLIFAVPDAQAPDGRRALLVLTSGAHRVDTAKVAALVGAARLDRADADFVRERTGFAIGGVAPVGHTGRVRTLVDRALADHDEVWAAAGHPRTVFPTSFDELVRITGGEPADVA